MSIKTAGPSVIIDEQLLRPNDTTQYAAGDVVDNVTSGVQGIYEVARVNGGSGQIVSASLAVTANQTSVLTGSFELWLFDTAVASHESDADTFTPTDADLLNLVGILQFTTAFEADLTVGAGGIVAYMAAGTFLPLSFTCTALSKDLHGTLVVRNAYTPTAFEQFYLRVGVEQD